ncbi:MAG: hypothetical protein ACE5MB_11150 [Anaerolineae bacterium]
MYSGKRARRGALDIAPPSTRRLTMVNEPLPLFTQAKSTSELL